MGTLSFAAFGQDDNRLGGTDIGWVYLTTRGGALCGPPLLGGDKGLEIDTARLRIPGGEGCVLNVHWAMPEFGYLWVQADNGGQTYRLPPGGASQVWNLNYELARTRALWNAQLEQVAAQQVVTLPAELRQALDRAGSLLHDAMFANHDRRSHLADDALAKALDAGERLAVHVAQTLIRVTRSRAAATDSALRQAPGEPVAPSVAMTPVAATPVLRHFAPLRFTGPVDETTAALWRAVFDEGVIEFGSADLPAAGANGPSAPPADPTAAIEFLERVGARVRGRALLPQAGQAAPSGQAAPTAQLAAASAAGDPTEWRRAAVATAEKWRRRIGVWELVPPRAGLNLSSADAQAVIETARAVKQACPEVELVLTPGEFFVPRMAAPGAAPAEPAPAPMDILVYILRQCPEIDAVGVPLGYPGCDLVQIFRTVDIVADAGRPVHLLLAAAPSQWSDDPAAELGRGRPDFARQLGYWRQPWSPAVQAQWAMGLFLMARAHPGVAAVEWCDFSDRDPHLFPFGGLLDAAGRPKPLHERLAAARQSHYDLPQPWSAGL